MGCSLRVLGVGLGVTYLQDITSEHPRSDRSDHDELQEIVQQLEFQAELHYMSNI